ncbi:hypothetical protein [Anaerotignum sp.]
MKKFGLLLCLLLGLTACGQAEKEPVFATLDEAIEAHLQQNPGDELEEICQIENAHIAVFSGDVEDISINEKFELPAVVAYFRVYEEKEEGFVLRDETSGFHLDDTRTAIGVLGDASWITGVEESGKQYHLRGIGFGDTMPTAEEIKGCGWSDFGEIHEKEGLYFAFAFGLE